MGRDSGDSAPFMDTTDDDDNGYGDDDDHGDDIYIMMQCLSVCL